MASRSTRQRVLALRLDASTLPPRIEIETADGRQVLQGDVVAKVHLSERGIDAWLDAERDGETTSLYVRWAVGHPAVVMVEG